MRAGLKCYVKSADLWGRRAVAWEEHRPSEDQEIVHVMCFVPSDEGPGSLVGSVPMPNTWEAVTVDEV